MFIKLNAGARVEYVNSIHIVEFWRDSTGQTRVELTNQIVLDVTETPEQIMDMLGDDAAVVSQYKQVMIDSFNDTLANNIKDMMGELRTRGNPSYARGRADAMAGLSRQPEFAYQENAHAYENGYKEGWECLQQRRRDTK